MSCFPYPRDTDVEAIRVPLIARIQYSTTRQTDFSDFFKSKTSEMFYSAFYFLSSLKPPRINAEDHSSCSSDRCLVTSKLSKPLHRTDGCLCEDVVVPVDRVYTIVASGGIPLIRITRSPLGKIELEVVLYTPSSRFIAISHVWGDQHFGSAQNCLPKC
ncbi:hypothetical protein IWW34DRAFT_105279 [Fusarium oxysporum f. sp. albedinis]|jgi:hypothetical protein|nr:hypothetical protein IWW34DRAFT_105279 [Fusarium oxysporum f. sp. albedinis]KAJ0136118.1 Uncharacterized protein HZ326_20876 [Fusarium oxysporum f. sp. albedinis]